MNVRFVVMVSLAGCAGPDAHRQPAAGAALDPAAAEAGRAAPASTLSAVDPLEAPHCGLPTASDLACPTTSASPHHPATVSDPVCKMAIDPKTAKGGSLQLDGQTYFFCSTTCRTTFHAQHPGAK